MFHKKGLSFDLFSDDSRRESIKATSQPELKANARKNDDMVGERHDVMPGTWIWLVKMTVIMDHALSLF